MAARQETNLILESLKAQNDVGIETRTIREERAMVENFNPGKENLVALAQKDIDWNDIGGGEEIDEENLTEVRSTLRRSQRGLAPLEASSSLSAGTSSSNSSSNNHCSSEQEHFAKQSGTHSGTSSQMSILPLSYHDQVDVTHGELLKKVEELTNRYNSIQSFLDKAPPSDQILFMHILEEQIVLARKAEMDYLRQCPQYRKIYNSRMSEIAEKPLPVFPDRRVHVRDENGKWPSNPITDAWILIALAPDAHDYPKNIKHDIDKNPDAVRNCKLGVFHQKLNNLTSLYNICTVARNEIISLIVENTDLDLGVRRHPTTNNIIHTSDEYLPHDLRHWMVDVCVNQCVLFIGPYEEYIKCPVCDTHRYTKCNYGGKCADGINCSPFVNLSHKYRSSLQTLSYRYVFSRA